MLSGSVPSELGNISTLNFLWVSIFFYSFLSLFFFCFLAYDVSPLQFWLDKILPLCMSYDLISLLISLYRDLSVNMLSGNVPSELGKLASLSVL
jgi:hypothetical protein